MREAMFYETVDENIILCTLCSQLCRIKEAKKGVCGVRINLGGTLYTLVEDRVIARHTDPIEKKPLFHFYPGSRAYSIATVGCNFRCFFCQNWDIAQYPKRVRWHKREARYQAPEAIPPSFDEMIPGEKMTPWRNRRSGRGFGQQDDRVYLYRADHFLRARI